MTEDRSWTWRKKLVGFWGPVLGISLTLWGATYKATTWIQTRQGTDEAAAQYAELTTKVSLLEARLREELERTKREARDEATSQLSLIRDDLRGLQSRIDAIYKAVR